MARLWIVAVPVVVMLIVFVALLVYAQRGGRSRRRGHRFTAAPVPGTEAALPEDPSAALAELRRRAEAPDS